VEIEVLPSPEGSVIARGSYYGGPKYEFFLAEDGHVDFRVVGDSECVWAGPDQESFRRIVAAWKWYGAEITTLSSETARQELVDRMRKELERLGALPVDLPPLPEPLWSLLLFEAEHGLG
jgi:hypothetical protein